MMTVLGRILTLLLNLVGKATGWKWIGAARVAFFPVLIRWGKQAVQWLRGIDVLWRLAMIVPLLAFFPLPDGVMNLPGLLASLPDPAPFFIYMTQLQFGLEVVPAAYVTRFAFGLVYRAVMSK